MADLFICPDCELPVAEEGSLCEACAAWRAQKMAAMDSEYQEQQRRRERMQRLIRAKRGGGLFSDPQDFAEGLSDMVKAVERSRR